MAMTGATVFNGQDIAAAYVVISRVSFITPYIATIQLGLFLSQEEYSKGTRPLTEETRSYAYDGKSAPWDFFEKQIIAAGMYSGFAQVATAEVSSGMVPVRTSDLVTDSVPNSSASETTSES